MDSRLRGNGKKEKMVGGVHPTRLNVFIKSVGYYFLVGANVLGSIWIKGPVFGVYFTH